MKKIMFLLLGSSFMAFSEHNPQHLGMSDSEIQYLREKYIADSKRLVDKGIWNRDRSRDHDQEWRCEEDFEKNKKLGWMSEKDIAQWRRNKVSPQFTPTGRFAGIERQCGCFHPASLIHAFDPISGKEIELTAQEIVDRRNELWLTHLRADANADKFLRTYSPLRMTTHGKEMFNLVVIHAGNGRVLRLTRNHGVLIFPGLMVQAKNVSLEDRLYDMNGSLVDVVSLSSESLEDEVVNVETNPTYFKSEGYEESPLEHIIFASGLAVGDLRWQNNYTIMLNQLLW